VIGRRGGINKGSLVSLVQGLKKQQAEDGKKDEELGIVLANLGELWWWPEGKRGLTPRGRHGVPMASCVHLGRWHDKKVNEIPLNRSPAQHVKCVFESVVLGGEEGKKVPDDAMLDIIAVGDGADEVEKYLDQEEVWAKIGDRLNSFVNLNGNYSATKLTCNGFKKFMEDVCKPILLALTLIKSTNTSPARPRLHDAQLSPWHPSCWACWQPRHAWLHNLRLPRLQRWPDSALR
jgi:Arb2 domain.